MNPSSWQRKATEAVAMLLTIAIIARVIYGLLAPLLPLLGTVVVLGVVYWLLFRGWRR